MGKDSSFVSPSSVIGYKYWESVHLDQSCLRQLLKEYREDIVDITYCH